MRVTLKSAGSVATVMLAILAACASLDVAVASASTSSVPAPAVQTTDFVCTNGVCAAGPGDLGVPFAAGLIGTGGPTYYGPECNAYLMTVVSGSLPPGLQLGEPVCEWVISGIPTRAGTYSFTVQIAPQPNNLGQPAGPSGKQQFTITIGTGTSDRLLLTSAVWASGSVNKTLELRGFDANNGATYTVYVTSTGADLGSFIESTPDNGGDGSFGRAYTEHADLGNLTVKDSLGGLATITVTVNTKY